MDTYTYQTARKSRNDEKDLCQKINSPITASGRCPAPSIQNLPALNLTGGLAARKQEEETRGIWFNMEIDCRLWGRGQTVVIIVSTEPVIDKLSLQERRHLSILPSGQSHPPTHLFIILTPSTTGWTDGMGLKTRPHVPEKRRTCPVMASHLIVTTFQDWSIFLQSHNSIPDLREYLTWIWPQRCLLARISSLALLSLWVNFGWRKISYKGSLQLGCIGSEHVPSPVAFYADKDPEIVIISILIALLLHMWCILD